MALQNSHGPPRVLIADADPVMRTLLRSMVAKKGYEVVVVEDGREVYRILKSDSNFSAAIFEMMMPHLQGLDIINYMRTEKRLRRIPVLLISAERDLQLMAKSFMAGATLFLTKPFNPDQFKTTLGMLLKNRVPP